MSNELLSQLENRVTSAVDTIEDLRAEVRVLKEERENLENKLRDLLGKIDRIGAEEAAAPEASGEVQGEQQSYGSYSQPQTQGYGSSDF